MSRWSPWTVIGLLFLAGLSLHLWRTANTRSPAARTAIVSVKPHEEVASIAVLPFVSMNSRAEDTAVSMSLSRVLTDELGKESGLRVVPWIRTASYQQSNLALREIAREVGAEHILEGSTLGAGDRVRVTVQLIHAPTEHHLWSESFDRPQADLPAIQREIAQQVKAALKRDR